MNKTKIEWADMTWNPVTGCLHGCEYCYARRMAQRFGGNEFAPTFHSYRLNEPQSHNKPQNVFVCSMADLFGDWVPDEWIEQVFAACEKAPWHRYLFLTKNPERYEMVPSKYRVLQGSRQSNMWFGHTITKPSKESFTMFNPPTNMFISIEPFEKEFKEFYIKNCKWIIIGAETGNRKNKVTPERKWIERIVDFCRCEDVPVFMKDSLKGIWQGELVREFPWGDK